mgnify:FL=1
MPTPDRDALLADLRRLRDEFDRLPSGQTVTDHGQYSLDDYRETFGSFPDALAAAGFDLPDFDFMPSNAQLLSDLHRIFAIVHKRPTHADVDEHGKWYPELYKRRWGDFTSALRAAGFRTDGPAIPDAELIADVRRVGDAVDGRLTKRKYNDHGRVTFRAVDMRIGWPTAMEQAGLRNPDDPGPVTYSDEEILEDIARVWREVGHAPSASEMDDHGDVSVGTVAYHFGRWTAGKECVDEQFDVP